MRASYNTSFKLASLPAKILSALLNKNSAFDKLPANIISNNINSKRTSITYTGHHLSDKPQDYWANYIVSRRNGIVSSEGTDQTSETNKDSRSRHKDELKEVVSLSVDKELSNETNPAKREAIIRARLISDEFTKKINEVSQERTNAEEMTQRHWRDFVLNQQQKERQIQIGQKHFAQIAPAQASRNQ